MSTVDRAELSRIRFDIAFGGDYGHAGRPGQRGGSAPGKGNNDAYQMYSPNVEESMDFEEAQKRMHSDDQARFRAISQDVDQQLGFSAVAKDAIGDWSDGAENSIFNEISNDGDWDKVVYSAAVKGSIANQKAVIAFQRDANGKDSVYTFELPQDVEQARETLSKAGLQFRTLMPKRGSTQVVIFDPGTEMIDKVGKLGEDNGIEIQQVAGRGEFIGGETRTEGQRAYKQVIQAYESSHPQHYQRSSGRMGLPDYWRSQIPVAASDPGHAGRPGQRGGSAPGDSGHLELPGIGGHDTWVAGDSIAEDVEKNGKRYISVVPGDQSKTWEELSEKERRNLPLVYRGEHPKTLYGPASASLDHHVFVSNNRKEAAWFGKVKVYRVMPGAKLYADPENEGVEGKRLKGLESLKVGSAVVHGRYLIRVMKSQPTQRLYGDKGMTIPVSAAFNPDEARDERGRWTGVGVKYEGGAHKLETGEALPKHIAKLRIPPAWTNVKVSLNPKDDLWVKGTDAKGRQQYIYSPKHVKSASLQKFARIQKIESKFEKIAARNEANVGHKNPAKADAADVMRLVFHTGIRPGSEKDTGAEKQAYGATTLLGKHVIDNGDGTVNLQFVGKKGVSLNIPVTDSKIASMLTDRAKASGPDGKLFPNTDSTQLLAYTKSIGGQIKTKDFRTLLANRIAKQAVESMPAPTSQKGLLKSMRAVGKIVADKLGNSAAIALKNYINPHVFARWSLSETTA